MKASEFLRKLKALAKLERKSYRGWHIVALEVTVPRTTMAS